MSCPICDLEEVGALGSSPVSPLALIAIGTGLSGKDGPRAVTRDICDQHLFVWTQALCDAARIAAKLVGKG